TRASCPIASPSTGCQSAPCRATRRRSSRRCAASSSMRSATTSASTTPACESWVGEARTLGSMNRETRLQVVLGLNLVLVGVLVAFGFLAHSLGLLADAWDTVADVAAVLVALVAVRLTRRSPTTQRSFGYHRSTI